MKNYQIYILFIVSCTFIFGCAKKNPEVTGSSNLSSNTDGDLQPTANFMWVHHKAAPGVLRYTHKAVSSGPWTEQCKVDLDAVNGADRDIVCIADSTELDLMHTGINLQYNIPVNAKCPYVLTMTPYFFRYEPARYDSDDSPVPEFPHLPPGYVEIVDDKVNGTYTVTAWYDSSKTKANPYFQQIPGGYRCGFDYSYVEGPNCCPGKYALKTTTITTETPAGETENSEGDWGGSATNCLAGPALKLNQGTGSNSWPSPKIWSMNAQGATQLKPKVLDSFQSPLTLIQKLDGLEFKVAEEAPADGKEVFGNIEITSLFDDLFIHTRYVANYFTGTTPKAFSDILDYFDPEMPPGYLWKARYADPRYYTFLCLDSGEEVTARIRVMVREWNSYDALKIATEPTAGEDNSYGTESDFPEFPIHDHYDWNDTDGWCGPWRDSADADTIPDYRCHPSFPDPGTYPGMAL
jgi:hypothetical protein